MIDLGRIHERMRVISSDDHLIGVVARVGTDLLVTCTKNGCGFDHLIPLDWIDEVDDSVFLSKSRRFLQANCTDRSRRTCQKAA